MSRIKIKVSELPSATTIDGLHTLGVDNANKSVKVPIALLKGNQGDAFTYADFSAAQIAELQRPATDAIADTVTATTNANKATTDAVTATANANEAIASLAVIDGGDAQFLTNNTTTH